MARTRSPTLYPQKRAMLLEVAQRMFLQLGYDGTSMSKLAQEAEVAPNTLYHYFADKDALLVEALNATLLRNAQAFGKRMDDPLEAQLSWLLGVLDEVQPLIATVHTRAAVSPAVHQWHEQFHAFFEAQFVEQLRKLAIPSDKRRAAAHVVMYVLEGMVSHKTSASERRDLLKLLTSLVPLLRGP